MDGKEEQMEILKLKKNSQNKESSLSGLSIRMEMTEERVCELEDRPGECAPAEPQRETWLGGGE